MNLHGIVMCQSGQSDMLEHLFELSFDQRGFQYRPINGLDASLRVEDDGIDGIRNAVDSRHGAPAMGRISLAD